jgi:hypothetical protein
MGYLNNYDANLSVQLLSNNNYSIVILIDFKKNL